MKHCFRLLAMTMLLAATGFFPRTAAAQDSFTYADLVKREIDLEHLAVLPAKGETCVQWSSYDRASKVDEKTGKYVRWDANGDGNGFIRKEGNLFVLAEMDGPGCIWRIWSAAPKKGRVKIYLDGQTEPTIDLPFEKFFSGDTAPFNYPLLSYDLGRMKSSGQNLYQPIPYQKSCKIVAEENWGQYFQFVYSSFPKGTKLPTFSAALAAENADALKKVNAFFDKQLGADPAGKRASEQTVKKAVRAAAGQTVAVAQLTGPQAITAIRVKTAFKNREDQMAGLRRMALRITWDGQSKPAVWSPLGDFFGTAPGENLYRSLTTGMTEDGYYSYWYMPFASSAVVELVNEDAVEREVQFEIVHAPLGRPFEGLGHFHAKWHRDTVTLSEDRWPDWTMLLTQGRGRFCGVMLHVWNPRGGWWGEGDEKFFVDGEKFPSTIGTGSEDYFGYAWCCPALFQRPFHCQTMTQGNRGHQSVLRWHVMDNIPFEKSFEACIEKYYRTEKRGTQYACLSTWYLDPQGTDSYEPVPVDKRDTYYDNSSIMAAGFKVIGDPQGNVDSQDMAHFKDKWTNGDQLWWTGARPGSKLTLALPVAAAGNYCVQVVMTKAIDYGIVQFSIDGQKIGEPIDLFNKGVIRTKPLELGTLSLDAGEHKLTIEVTGANPEAKKSYMVGLDEVLLVPAKK